MNTNNAPKDSAYLTALGTVTTDATLATAKNNKEYGRFTLKAEVGKDTFWLSIIAFDADAVESVRQVRKGCRVDVGGRLQIRAWTGTDGKERTSVGIVANAIAVVSQPDSMADDPSLYDDVPF
jgi:single-stranded DNA-binding protein